MYVNLCTDTKHQVLETCVVWYDGGLNFFF